MTEEDRRVDAGGRSRGISRLEFLRMAGVGAGLAATPGFLASCEAIYGGGGGSSEGGAIELFSETSLQAPLQELISRYRENHPDFKVKSSYAETDALMNTTRTQIASNNAPDLMQVWPGTGGNAMAVGAVGPTGALADLSDQPWVDRIPQDIKSLFEYKGKTLYYSPGRAVIGAIYYKPIFEDLGLETPKTWDELLSASEKIKKSGKYPFAIGNKDVVFTQFMNYALVPSTVYAENPNFDEDMARGKATFEHSGWKDAFEKYVELEKRGYFNPDSLGTSSQEATEMFFSGRAAMLVTPVVGLGDLEEQYDAVGKTDVFVVPGVNDPEKVWASAGLGSGLGVYSESEKVDEAKAFIEFLGEQENANTFAEMLGFLPITPNREMKVDPFLKTFLPYVEQGKSIYFPDQKWPNAEVQQTHFAVIQQVFAGEITIDEALRQMDKTYQQG
jgi:raffinose/stachyose/melibiose transport system substrate-binding protein